jgi:hypothetical protein
MDIKTVLDQVSSGAFDSDLNKLVDAVNARLTVVRKAKKISDFNIGDRVKFNELTGTRYMVGQYATVISKNRTKVVVRLETPMGRFARYLPNGEVQSSNVTVPLSIIDPA